MNLDQATDRGRRRRRKIIGQSEEPGGESESEIEIRCANVVARHAGMFWKMRLVGRRGGPDRLLILPDMPIVFVELKSGSGEQSPLQRNIESLLIGMGQRYWLVQSPEQLDDRIRSFTAFERGLRGKPSRDAT